MSKSIPLYWSRPSESGLGDRLVDMIQLLAYCRIKGYSILHLHWPGFIAKEIDCAHRVTDIQLANVQAHIRIPPNVVFGDKPHDGDVFDHTLGGDAGAGPFHRGYLKNDCSVEEFIRIRDEEARRFGFCDDINAFMGTIPAGFVSFHIRRGDKVRNEPSDGCFIHSDELPELNRMTRLALQSYLDEGAKCFFFCGDQDDKTSEFVNFVHDRGAATFSLPSGLHKWQQTYYDLATMTRGSSIVTSQRYSAFSAFSALVGNLRYQTAYGRCVEMGIQ